MFQHHQHLKKHANLSGFEGEDIITSVDPAPSNCGIAKYSVPKDKFLFLDLADLRVSRAGDIVDKLHEYRTEIQPESFSDTDLVVVEQQMCNNPANMCIETTLRAEWRGQCICVPPQVVMKHFKIPKGTPRSEKKKRMVKLMQNLFTPQELQMVNDVVENRRLQNKKARKAQRLEKAAGKKRKRTPLPFSKIKYDDIMEAAAQALWAAEMVLGHRVARRMKKKTPKKSKRRPKRHKTPTSVECIVITD